MVVVRKAAMLFSVIFTPPPNPLFLSNEGRPGKGPAKVNDSIIKVRINKRTDQDWVIIDWFIKHLILIV